MGYQRVSGGGQALDGGVKEQSRHARTVWAGAAKWGGHGRSSLLVSSEASRCCTRAGVVRDAAETHISGSRINGLGAHAFDVVAIEVAAGKPGVSVVCVCVCVCVYVCRVCVGKSNRPVSQFILIVCLPSFAVGQRIITSSPPLSPEIVSCLCLALTIAYHSFFWSVYLQPRTNTTSLPTTIYSLSLPIVYRSGIALSLAIARQNTTHLLAGCQ